MAFPFSKTQITNQSKGGQTTISPPPKVKSDVNIQVLASNIDTLYLSINVNWRSGDLFQKLTTLKQIASEENEEQNIILKDRTNSDGWIFSVLPNGAPRYEWLIRNHDYTLKIGNWYEPQSVPSIMVEIRSEALWAMGPENAVFRIIDLIKGQKAKIESIRPSRVDMCVDLLVPDTFWTEELLAYKVTRAYYEAKHSHGQNLTGFSIGKGNISARLYDKVLEITQKQDKLWMLDIYNLHEGLEGKKIIRIEFQLRREILKQLGIDTFGDLFGHYQNAWAYCTQNWLKFQSNPGKHHTQRKTLPWWEIVQNGFMGFQSPNPLIRSKAQKRDMAHLACQAYGLLTSLQAAKMGTTRTENKTVDFREVLSTLLDELIKAQKDGETLNRDIQNKIAKYYRGVEKLRAATKARRHQGHTDPAKLRKKGPSP